LQIGGEELQAPKGAFEEESTLEDVKLSLRWRLKECKKLQKEKDETLEILTGHVESIRQRLNGAIEARSKAETTIKELNGKLIVKILKFILIGLSFVDL